MKRTLVSMPVELQSVWFWKQDQLTFIWIPLLLSEKKENHEGVQFQLSSSCSMMQPHMGQSVQSQVTCGNSMSQNRPRLFLLLCFLQLCRASLSNLFLLFMSEAGGRSSVVVFHLQGHWVSGHSVFHLEEEVQSGYLPARVPPLHHVHAVVDRHQMGGWRTVWVL